MKKATFKAKGLWASLGAAAVAAIVAVVVAGGSLATAAVSCNSGPESFWPASTPTSVDASDVNSVNVGLHFKSDVSGQVSAVRFYKGATNTGTHIGSLWSTSGTLLESVTFTNESASGWQIANFSSPVEIAANTDYVVSYLAPVGKYAYDMSYFTSAFTAGDLTASTSNGVYSYGSTTTFPKNTSVHQANYWVDLVFTPDSSASPSPSATSASPSTSPSASPSTSPSSSPSTSPSSSPSTSPSSSPSPTQTVPPGSYVQPGTVGYLGAASALTEYSPAGSGLPGAGNAPPNCAWQSYGLRCSDDNYTMDHVKIDGGVYWSGVGTFTLTNSVILGGAGSEWYDLLGHPSSTATINPGFNMVVHDSTLAWQPGKTFPCCEDVAPIWSIYGNQAVDAQRDDLSGFPQGLPGGVGSQAINNWIHGLVQNGTSSAPSHIDGVYNQSGSGWLVEGNYIDAPVRGDVTAALFDQDSPMDTGVVVKDNFLNGGAYNLVNDSASGMDVENNTFGANVYGFAAAPGGTVQGTYSTWSGNVDTSGNPIPEP